MVFKKLPWLWKIFCCLENSFDKSSLKFRENTGDEIKLAREQTNRKLKIDIFFKVK